MYLVTCQNPVMVEIRKVDYKGGHRYRVIGDPAIAEKQLLPSCSTIAKHADSGGGDGLINWALDAWETTGQKDGFELLRNQATDIGTGLHKEIHEYISRKIQDDSHEPENPSDLFGKWYSSMHERGVKWIGAEIMVYHRELLYGGTIDALAVVDGKPTIFDWKTTTQLNAKGKKKYFKSADHAVQVAGYLMALKSTSRNMWLAPDVQTAYIVYIYRDTMEIEWREINIDKAMVAFRACNTLYDIKGGLYERTEKKSV
jgi:hypothetical protein